MDNILLMLNQSKIVWGVSMLLLQFGARYIISDLGKSHEIILTNEFTKKIIILALFFVATRDIVTSFILTIIYVIVIDGVLHEKRKICLLPKSFYDKHTEIPQADYIKAKEIIEKYNKQIEQLHTSSENNKKEMNSTYLNYISNLSIL